LVVQAEGEGGEPDRQVAEFLDSVTYKAEMIRLKGEFGADNHCGLNNIPYTSSIVYDWISQDVTLSSGEASLHESAGRCLNSR
jgi:hypothetical protein